MDNEPSSHLASLLDKLGSEFTEEEVDQISDEDILTMLESTEYNDGLGNIVKDMRNIEGVLDTMESTGLALEDKLIELLQEFRGLREQVDRQANGVESVDDGGEDENEEESEEGDRGEDEEATPTPAPTPAGQEDDQTSAEER